MVMESAPAAAFIVIQPDFVLEFLKIPLDAPADFDQPDQLRELHRPGHGREPVTGWFGFSAGPLNQQQFRYSWFHSQIVAMGHADLEQRETGLHCPLGAFAPAHGLPTAGVQAPGQRPQRNWPMIRIAPQARGWPTATTATWRPHGSVPPGPNRGLVHNPHSVRQAARAEAFAKLARRTVAGVRHHRRPRQIVGQQPIDLSQCQLPFFFKPDLVRNARSSTPWPLPCPASIIAILLQSPTPFGVTFCHVFPPSRVRWSRPVSLPAHISSAFSGEGAMLYTTPKPRSFAFCTVAGPAGFSLAGFGAAPVRSGLIFSQCRPPSVVFITYCVPR